MSQSLSFALGTWLCTILQFFQAQGLGQQEVRKPDLPQAKDHLVGKDVEGNLIHIPSGAWRPLLHPHHMALQPLFEAPVTGSLTTLS